MSSLQYADGSDYNGECNQQCQRHGLGKMTFPDKSTYHGNFDNGLCHGLGVMVFADASRYEGNFKEGKFSGLGVFSGSDGVSYTGEFRDGKILGSGLVQFADGSHGQPRNEGYFEGGVLARAERCPDVIKRATDAAEAAIRGSRELIYAR